MARYKKMPLSKGFTLIELLVVIAVIGSLAYATFVAVVSTLNKSKVSNIVKYASSLQRTMGLNAAGIWHINEGSGTLIADDSGHSRNGTVVGGATWLTSDQCKLNNNPCMRFDGSTGYISVPNMDPSFIDLGQENSRWTMAIWAREVGNNFNGRTIFGKAACPSGFITGIAGYTFGIRTHASCLPGAAEIHYSPSNMKEWHFLVGVYDNRNMTFYVDGENVGTAYFSGTMYNYNNTIGIGGDAYFYFSGDLDDAQIYMQTLTAFEIRELYKEQAVKYLAARKLFLNSF